MNWDKTQSQPRGFCLIDNIQYCFIRRSLFCVKIIEHEFAVVHAVKSKKTRPTFAGESKLLFVVSKADSMHKKQQCKKYFMPVASDISIFYA